MSSLLTARLLARLRAHVARYRLWSPGERVLVAVSGGADSTALLLLLAALAPEQALDLTVAHADHGWRQGSAADAEFVRALALRLGLPFFCATPPAWPAGNLEAAARRWRYSWLSGLIADGHASVAATGHTRDDQAETVLLRLFAGAGPSGLAGIAPLRHLAGPGSARLLRPLLPFGRDELRLWLRQCGQPWREDPGNQRLDRVRNRLRHSVLPWLAMEFNPQLSRQLARLAELAFAEERYWAGRLRPLLPLWVPEAPAGSRIPLAALWPLPSALRRRLIRAGLRRAGLSRPRFQLVEQLLDWVGSPPPSPRSPHPRRLRQAEFTILVTPHFLSIHPVP